MLIIIGYLASTILLLASTWAVFSNCVNDGVLMKNGLILLAFGSCANLIHPSDQGR